MLYLRNIEQSIKFNGSLLLSVWPLENMGVEPGEPKVPVREYDHISWKVFKSTWENFETHGSLCINDLSINAAAL